MSSINKEPDLYKETCTQEFSKEKSASVGFKMANAINIADTNARNNSSKSQFKRMDSECKLFIAEDNAFHECSKTDYPKVALQSLSDTQVLGDITTAQDGTISYSPPDEMRKLEEIDKKYPNLKCHIETVVFNSNLPN